MSDPLPLIPLRCVVCGAAERTSVLRGSGWWWWCAPCQAYTEHTTAAPRPPRREQAHG